MTGVRVWTALLAGWVLVVPFGPGDSSPMAGWVGKVWLAAWTSPEQPGAETATGEVFSNIADLWRERDAFYLRADGRMPKVPGMVPAGAREVVVRVEALTRGRDWPGRWTMVEVEVRPKQVERVRMSSGSEAAEAEITPAAWSALRLPVGTRATDVVLKPAEGASRSEWEFRRVRLVDDRREFVGKGSAGWKVERRAGWLRFETGTSEWRVPAIGLRVVEAGEIRVRMVDGSGRGAAVYASGRVSVEAGSVVAGWVPPGSDGGGRLEVRITDDVGRVDRQTDGDADGDGFNEARGASIVRASARQLHLFVRPADDRPVRNPALEVRGLAAGRATVLREGSIVNRTQRLADGTLLIELPGEVRGEQRLDIRVEEGG